MKTTFKLILVVVTSFSLAAASAYAVEITPGSLPPAAQESLNKGIIAAKLPDYLLAIRFFEEARKIAPQDPVIYLNLGLAESKIPGRELRAIAWFGAYLAAYPEASNAAAVKEQIAVLEVKNQSNVSRLIQTLQDSPAKDYSRIADVARLWADSGDYATALKTALLAGEIYGGSAQSYITAVQAKAGDIAGALHTAGVVERLDYRSDAFLEIAFIQLERGDLEGFGTTIVLARRASDQILDGHTKWNKLNAIAELQVKAGAMDGAQATLRVALTAVDLIVIPTEPERKDPYLSSRAQGQTSIANIQISAGDVAGAKQSLALAFKNSELISDPYQRSFYQRRIFESYGRASDVRSAIQTLKAYQKSVQLIADANIKREFTDYDVFTPRVVVDAQLNLGDFAAAVQTANAMKKGVQKESALGGIINAQVKAGDYRGAVKTNAELADADKRAYSLYNIVKAQAEVKDFVGAAKNAELIQVSKYKEFAVRAIAEESAKANDPVMPGPAQTLQPVVAKSSPPARTAADWVKMLDDNSRYGVALNTEPFLNLAGYLKSLPPSDNPEKVFESLHETAKTIVKAQNVITAMLKEQAGK